MLENLYNAKYFENIQIPDYIKKAGASLSAIQMVCLYSLSGYFDNSSWRSWLLYRLVHKPETRKQDIGCNMGKPHGAAAVAAARRAGRRARRHSHRARAAIRRTTERARLQPGLAIGAGHSPRSRTHIHKPPPIQPHWLSRLLDTTAQAQLGRRARLHNLRHAFAADPRHAAAIAGQRILLVDDVMTTGATASAVRPICCWRAVQAR